jgi:formate dehydrogenase major subunit
MYCEINPFDGNNAGIRDGSDMWLHTPEGAKIKVKALHTERVNRGLAWLCMSWGGHWEGESRASMYPAGTAPYVLGEAANTAMTYGYDSVTLMQETKVSLCRIEAA